MKKFFALLLAMVLAMAGCGLLEAKEETFSKDGLTITLTNRFREYDATAEGYSVAYDSATVAVFAMQEQKADFATMGLEPTLEEYAQLVIEANDFDSTVSLDNNLVSFTYEGSNEGVTYTYLACVYETEEAYWLVQFACEADKYENLQADILKYAQSVIVA